MCNYKHRRGKLVVKNSFGIIKLTINFIFKKQRHVTILLEVFSACCLFHNLIFKKKELDVEEFMWVIQMEVGMQDVNDTHNGLNHGEDNVHIQVKIFHGNNNITT